MELVASKISNQDLLEKCIQGDRTAQCQVYKQYYKMVFHSALRILGNKVEAEDIMQESFIEAFQKIGSLQEKEKFGGWLKRIAINKSINELKSKSRFTQEIENDQIPALEDPNLDEELMKLECNRLKECMEKLPDGFKMISKLYLLEGYDHVEIGEILGITSSTSRSQFTRAKVKIKELYKSNYE